MHFQQSAHKILHIQKISLYNTLFQKKEIEFSTQSLTDIKQ